MLRHAPLSILLAALSLAACGEDDSAKGGPGDGGMMMPDAGDPPLPEGPAAARFDLAGDFFAAPWPFELRRGPTGRPDIADYPNGGNAPLFRTYIEVFGQHMQDFGCISPIYLPFDGPLELEGLPPSAADSLTESSALHLVNVEPDSPRFGERTPLEWQWNRAEGLFLPAHTLAVRPVNGFSLCGGDRHALIALDLIASDGSAVSPAPELAAALISEGEPAFSAAFGPLRRYLEAQSIDPSRVSHATLFRTQDPIGEIRSIYAAVQALPAPRARDLRYIRAFNPRVASIFNRRGNPRWKEQQRAAEEFAYFELRGAVDVPQAQEGESPFVSDGGRLQLDSAGNLQVTRNQKLRFALTIPQSEMPEGGWPVVLYAHGTFGFYRGFIGNGVARHLAGHGIAVLGIDQVVHGARNPEDQSPELLFFNITNPIAARDNPRQGAIDYFALLRAIEGLKIPAGMIPERGAQQLDPKRIFYMGHSQGGIVGPLILAAEPKLAGAVLSGAGGGFTTTLLERKDPADLKITIETFLNIFGREEIDVFHPVPGLLQSFVEASDAINYGRGIIRDPPRDADGNPHPIPLFMTEGLLDAATPPATTEGLASVTGLPLVGPIVRDIEALSLQGLEILEPPVSDNIEGPGGRRVTGGVSQYADDGHFAAFNNSQAAFRYARFLQSLAYEGQGRIE